MHAPYDVVGMTLMYLRLASICSECDTKLAQWALECVRSARADSLGLSFFLCWMWLALLEDTLRRADAYAHVFNKFAKNVTMYELILNVWVSPF